MRDRVTARARKFLDALKAEAADAPVIPAFGLGPMAALMAEAELELGGFITVEPCGYRLTPKGVSA